MKIFVFLNLLLSINSFGVTTKNCNDDQKEMIYQAYHYAIVRGDEMLTEVQSIPLEIYDIETQKKLKSATKVIKCTNKKLRKSLFACNEDHLRFIEKITEPIIGKLSWHKNLEGVAGITLPGIGKSAWLTDRFFNYTKSYKERADILFHEMTHKCWTNDRVYYHHLNLNPDEDSYSNWHRTAGFYDWWFVRGVCVPGYTCAID